MQAGTYGQWGALLAGGEVIYPTGYGTLVTAVINEVFIELLTIQIKLVKGHKFYSRRNQR